MDKVAINSLLEQVRESGFWGSLEFKFRDGNLTHVEVKQILKRDDASQKLVFFIQQQL